MRLADLVAAVHDTFDVPAAMADVAALCEHDRYQASAGIDAAAAYVAERAAAAGLAEVDVIRFPADGARRWWTFAGPVRWTPRRASVHVDGALVLSYPEQPYALAAYSAATPPGGRRLPVVRWSRHGERPHPAGALVVLDGVPLPAVLDDLLAARAAGVVADPLAGRAGRADRADRWPGQVGRIELPVGCPLFAFSVTERQLATIGCASAAHVLVDVDTAPGTLPVVTGRLPGGNGQDGQDELLLSAHLCHPRPSANDNASGVAALLGIARARAALPGGAGRAVRFVWGPEFVGLAAYLHDVVRAGRAPRPLAAVNVDMAGEDQRRGGPLVIERAADELASPISAVVERCAALLPARARSYSGAVPCDTWAWRATPYVGASDHAMLTGRPTCCPSVSLGHWPDPANHTSADTLDLVDGDELRRTATIAGAAVGALRAAVADQELSAELDEGTLAWAAAHVLSALPGSRAVPPLAASPAPPGPVLDPLAAGHAARLLAHRAEVAERVVPPRATEWITGLVQHLRRIIGPAAAEPAREPGDAEVLRPAWEGPMNLRRLAECAAPGDRRWLAQVTAHDRSGSYSRLLALARGLDGRRNRRAVAWWAALSSELAIPVPMAQRFLHLLCDAGWARTTEPASVTSSNLRGGQA
jgi:Peptidase family M28